MSEDDPSAPTQVNVNFTLHSIDLVEDRMGVKSLFWIKMVNCLETKIMSFLGIIHTVSVCA